MVTWASDGQVTGYDPTDFWLNQDRFLLASPGSVDLKGRTRLQYYLPPYQVDPVNKIQAVVTWTITNADLSTPDVGAIGPVLYVADADVFPPDYVPTPAEIVDNYYWRYWPAGFVTSAKTKTWTIPGLGPTTTTQLAPNNKIWVAVVPGTIHLTGDPDPITPWLNTVGRAISLLSNTSPLAPVITSPSNNVTIAPGGTFTLTYDPNDPDAISPDDSIGRNADLAGVQVQYSAPPTIDNPNPTWEDLPYWDGANHKDSWHIRGTNYGLAGPDSLLTARGLTVSCGTDTPPANSGVLPSGTWRLRCRTFDFGHPYPGFFPPLGVMSFNLYPGMYYASNTSPWSEPVTVNIPSQVSPPKLIAPVNNIAVPEGTTMRFQWRHQSAFVTPLGQTAREVQIKRVVDPTWVTVGAGVSTQQFLDLPPNYVAPPDVPTTEYLTDGGFEGGTVDGWFMRDWTLPDDLIPGTPTMANQNTPGNAHSGSRYVAVTNDGGGPVCPAFSKVVTLNSAHDLFDFTGWVFPVTSLNYVMYFQVEWLDASDVSLPEEDQPETQGVRFMEDDPWTVNTWVPFSVHVESPPPAAAKARLSVYGFGIGAGDVYDGTRLDDVSFIGSYSGNTDDFTMEATNRYEWRARTRDSDGVWSTFSASEKFWIVPAGASGTVRPIPAETIDGATLGCGTHRVEIFRRGGKVRVGELSGITHVDWSRRRDDISDSKVVIQDWDIDCGNLLAQLQSWAYEVVIHRDNGYSSERVWEGPITLLTYETDKVTIQAKDVMGYAYRRILKQAMSDAGTGNGTTVVDRARRVLQNAFAPDDPNVLAYLQVLAKEDDAMQYRSTPAYSRTAFEEVDDMAANAGLDYTTVGRSILLWGTKHRIGTLPEFKDADFAEAPIVSEYGMSMANRYVVSDGNGVWGEATRLDVSGNDETYGLVEMLSSTWASDSTEDSGTYTQEGLQTVIESFEGFAERSIADRYPPPVVVRIPDNTSLQPSAVVSIQHLVPGVVIPLRSTSTLRTVVQSQKLDSVVVTEEAGKETVQITMSPFSRDDNGGGEEVEV